MTATADNVPNGLTHEQRVEIAMTTITPKETVLGVLSTQVADKFGKKHCHVTRDIKNLISTVDVDFGESNFGLTTYVDCDNRSQSAYILTEAGFSLLVMGFTGEEAVKWKIAYITAFQRMRDSLLSLKAAPVLPNFMNPIEAARAWANECEAKQLAEAKLAIESAEKEKLSVDLQAVKQDFCEFKSVTRLSAPELAEVDQMLGDIYAQALLVHQKTPPSQRVEAPSVTAGRNKSRMQTAIKVLCGLHERKHTYKDAPSAQMPAIRSLLSAEWTRLHSLAKGESCAVNLLRVSEVPANTTIH